MDAMKNAQNLLALIDGNDFAEICSHTGILYLLTPVWVCSIVLPQFLQTILTFYPSLSSMQGYEML